MGSSLMERCIGVMASPRKTFLEASEDHNERHVILLSLIFGLLLAKQIIRSENRDIIFYLTTALASGVGFVFFAGFFLSWLIKISGPTVAPEKMRMVLSYALAPYILALVVLLLAKSMLIPKGLSIFGVALTIWSWGLAVFGVKTIGGIKLTQALIVVVIPVSALLLVISILFKVAWMMSGE